MLLARLLSSLFHLQEPFYCLSPNLDFLVSLLLSIRICLSYKFLQLSLMSQRLYLILQMATLVVGVMSVVLMEYTILSFVSNFYLSNMGRGHCRNDSSLIFINTYSIGITKAVKLVNLDLLSRILFFLSKVCLVLHVSFFFSG